MKKINILLILTIIFIFPLNSDDISESLLNLYNSPSLITNIQVRSTEKSIEVSFSNSIIQRELVIYRSRNPILNYNDLLQSSLIATFQSSDGVFVDYPLEGIPYFYLVMDSILTKSGKYIIVQGENVTSSSILIQTSNNNGTIEHRETHRNQPLPFLDLKASIESGKYLSDNYSELPQRQNLTFESENIVNLLLNNIYIDKFIELELVILDSDIGTSSNGEEYQLKRILESDFKNGNWIEANHLLKNYLNVDHSKNLEISAHFYLAQVLFFQNNYTASFMEFTLVFEDLPSKTRPWMDTILSYLQEKQ